MSGSEQKVIFSDDSKCERIEYVMNISWNIFLHNLSQLFFICHINT